MGRCVGAVLVLVVALCGAKGTFADGRARWQPTTNPTDRIRTDNADIRTLIADGLSRSLVFRRLVDAIAATDGIVYVVNESCGQRSARSCLSMTMKIAGDHRIVFVRLTPRRYDDVAIAALGHELQHAIEVFSDRTVRSDAEMYFLFRRIGSLLNGETFETHAARRVSNAILAELRQTASH